MNLGAIIHVRETVNYSIVAEGGTVTENEPKEWFVSWHMGIDTLGNRLSMDRSTEDVQLGNITGEDLAYPISTGDPSTIFGASQNGYSFTGSDKTSATPHLDWVSLTMEATKDDNLDTYLGLIGTDVPEFTCVWSFAKGTIVQESETVIGP